YMLAVDEYGEDHFTAMIGAEAIYEMLASMNLENIAGDLRAELADTTSDLKQKKLMKRLKIVDSEHVLFFREELVLLQGGQARLG
ncbi:hypothetical protein AB9F39_37130, partial [Rhizobium leguminosarum]|uniref:hypothetical protein n=1 Tax=Rhizobium leguminosarum TaxID=384 RepID=UPI003F9585FD